MKTVWKFTLAPAITFSIPKGAELLSVHAQGDDICVWALVDPEAEKEDRRFLCFGTGHNIPESDEGPELTLKFVGSAHLNGGALVFHVFESV